MEELLRHYILIANLTPSFVQKQWKILTRQTPQQFQANQQAIQQLLESHPALKQKYFQRFQRNHLAIYGWYLLASRDKFEIEAYLYRPLLQKTPSFHNSKLNTAIKTGYSKRNSRTEPSEIKKMFAQSLGNGRLQQLVLEQKQIDSHDLYLRTFVACRGQKYVPYNYDRHMRSEQQRANYNIHIRSNHKRNFTNPAEKEHKLQRFAEWTRSKEKTSLLSFRTVLQSQSLNSERGLQGLLKKQGSKKLVFVNHQRKPINYYLRPFNSRTNT